MKTRRATKILSVFLALTLVIGMTSAGASAADAESPGKGKYISEVFMAHGRTTENEVKWLKDNGGYLGDLFP